MKKNIILKLLASVLILTAISSCRKERVVGGTEVQNLSGQWWVKYDKGLGPVFGSSYYSFTTYNTAANVPTEMWLDDDHSGWDVKGKVKTDASALTFSGTNVQNVSYNSKFTVTEGKVILGVATAPGSKAKTDSIYFKISFDDDDPGKVYTVSGYKRTGYTTDDH